MDSEEEDDYDGVTFLGSVPAPTFTPYEVPSLGARGNALDIVTGDDDSIATSVRDALRKCFELAARTTEVLGSARDGDAAQQEAEQLAADFVETLTCVREDLRAAVEDLPEGDVHPERHSYYERLSAMCMSDRLRLANRMHQKMPDFAEFVRESNAAEANDDPMEGSS